MNNLNLKSMKEIRKKLRNNQTKAEVIVWSRLRMKNLGVKFRRQYSIEKFVFDFYCPLLKIAIEIDGDSHYTLEGRENDLNKNKVAKENGIKLLRFTNEDVYKNIDSVLDEIMKHI